MPRVNMRRFLWRLSINGERVRIESLVVHVLALVKDCCFCGKVSCREKYCFVNKIVIMYQ